MKKIHISIVTCNSKDIFVTLDNLLKTVDLQKTKITIFDNNSSADYKQKLKVYDKKININFSEDNLGFGAGHNKNLLGAKEDYFIIFNPDVLVDQKNIDVLENYCDTNMEAVLVSPKVKHPNGETQYLVRKNINLFDFFLRRQPIRYVRDVLFANRMFEFENRSLSTEIPSNIELASGCFMFIRSKAFLEVKGFDESFFMYFEDYDLSRRLGEKGKIIYHPEAEIIHFWERGSHKNKKLFLIFLSSMKRYFTKWGWKIA